VKIRHDEVIEEKAKNPNDKYLGFKFRAEMQGLMDELTNCECNFIRCIKPNAEKIADHWIEELALKQIKYLGVLDSIKVRRESLPVRRKFINFYEKYQDLDNFSKHKNISFVKLRERTDISWKESCEAIMKSVVPGYKRQDEEKEEILAGKTRVFMSVAFQNYLQELLDQKQMGKKLAMQKLSESMKSYIFAVRWQQAREQKVKVFNMAKDLLNTWNSKIEYIKFKQFLKVVKHMQLNFKLTVFKRHFRFYKNSS